MRSPFLPPSALSPPGKPETIGGQPGWFFSGRASAPAAALAVGAGPGTAPGNRIGPSCRQLGASWVIAATISLGPAPGDADQMLACLRGPDISTAATQILNMLRSLRLAH